MLKIKDMNLNNVVRQGDSQPREYQLDTGNLDLNLTNKSATIRLMTADFQGIGYETTATVSSDNKISFSIDNVIPAREYRLEVTVDDYVFPSRATDGQFSIDPSSHGQEVNIINVIGKDEIVRDVKEQVEDGLQPFLGEISQAELARQEAEGVREETHEKVKDLPEAFQNVIDETTGKDVISAPEIIAARRGKASLGEKIDEVTTQLAQIAINVSDFGAVGDGVTDDTEALQEAIDYATDNHLKLVSDYNKTYITNQLNIVNKHDFELDFRGVLKTPDNVTRNRDNNTTILRILDSSNFKINTLRGDGNALENGITSQTPISEYSGNYEYYHMLYLGGCTDVVVNYIEGLNMSGDVVCIAGVDHPNINNRIHFNQIVGKADEGIGRNTLSLVSGINVSVDVFESYNVGHVSMPGGLCIEPYSTQTIVENVYIGYLHVETYGFSGLGVLSLQNTLKNVNIDFAKIISLNTTGGYVREAIILGCKDININHLHIVCNHPSNSYGLAIGEIPNTPQPDVVNLTINNLVVEGGRYGLIMNNGFNINIKKARFINTKQYFMNIYDVDGFAINLTGSINKTIYTTAGVLLHGASSQKDVSISGDLSKEKVGELDQLVFMTNTDTVNIDNFVLMNLNLEGWELEKILGYATSQFDKINCNGLTTIENATYPPGHIYKIGDIVWVRNVLSAEGKRTYAYVRTNTGFFPLKF